MIIALSPARASETFLQLSNATLPPVTTPNGDGYLDRIAEEMFDRAGLKFELLKLPAARGLARSNTGFLDGELARINIRSDLYPNLQKLPEPIIDVIFAGLHHRASIEVKSLDDFKHFRVGYIRGWVVAENLFAGHENAYSTDNANQLLDMLEADRIDIAFMTLAPAHFLAKNRGIDKLQTTDFTLNKSLFLYLHDKHAGLLPGLTKALKSMKEDGTHQTIVRKYRW